MGGRRCNSTFGTHLPYGTGVLVCQGCVVGRRAVVSPTPGRKNKAVLTPKQKPLLQTPPTLLACCSTCGPRERKSLPGCCCCSGMLAAGLGLKGRWELTGGGLLMGDSSCGCCCCAPAGAVAGTAGPAACAAVVPCCWCWSSSSSSPSSSVTSSYTTSSMNSPLLSLLHTTADELSCCCAASPAVPGVLIIWLGRCVTLSGCVQVAYGGFVEGKGSKDLRQSGQRGACTALEVDARKPYQAQHTDNLTIFERKGLQPLCRV